MTKICAGGPESTAAARRGPKSAAASGCAAGLRPAHSLDAEAQRPLGLGGRRAALPPQPYGLLRDAGRGFRSPVGPLPLCCWGLRPQTPVWVHFSLPSGNVNGVYPLGTFLGPRWERQRPFGPPFVASRQK